MDTGRVVGRFGQLAVIGLGVLLAIGSPMPALAARDAGPLEVPASQRVYLLCNLSLSDLEVSAYQRAYQLTRSWLVGALEVPPRQRVFLQQSTVALVWEVPPRQRMYLLSHFQEQARRSR